MLWYKSWLETRWRFVIGLVLLMLSACGTVLTYPEVLQAAAAGAPGRSERRDRPARRGGDGAVAQLPRLCVVERGSGRTCSRCGRSLRVLLGTGGLLSQASGGGALFTLSLPVSRNRLLGVRAATGLAELLVLAFVPSLLLPVLSPAIGQTYGIGDALVHAACMFIGGHRVFQPGVSAVDRVQRRVASAADRCSAWRSCWRSSNWSFVTCRATACSGS